jgi:putative transposase
MRQQYSSAYKVRVVQELLREEKTVAQTAAESEAHPSQLGRWKSTAIQGLPSLFDRRDATEDLRVKHKQETTALYAEIGKLTTQVRWPGSTNNLASTLSGEERAVLVERGRPDVPLVTQADLLGLSRSSLYDQPVAPAPEEVALKHRIDALYTECPFYGSRRIAAVLGREGSALNRKAA